MLWIHLQDRYQICFYPLFHHLLHAEVELEIVDYIGVKNDLPVYACCSPGKKWVNLHFGGSFTDQMTVDDSLEGSGLEECILEAVSVMKRSSLVSNRVCMKYQRKTWEYGMWRQTSLKSNFIFLSRIRSSRFLLHPLYRTVLRMLHSPLPISHESR